MSRDERYFDTSGYVSSAQLCPAGGWCHSPIDEPPSLKRRSNYQVLLRPIKNILFISHIKKATTLSTVRAAVELSKLAESKSHNQKFIWKRLRDFLQRERETFYAHLSHFQQFRLKNSSKQFMAGRKNQIKIHAQQQQQQEKGKGRGTTTGGQ